MKQIIIAAVIFLYLNTAVLAVSRKFELRSQSMRNLPQGVPRYADNHLVSRNEPNFIEEFLPRSMDHSLSFLVEADLARREFGGSATMIERRTNSGQRRSQSPPRPGSVTSAFLPATQNSRHNSPRRISESHLPSQDEAKVIVSSKGTQTWVHTASTPGQQEGNHRSTWSGVSGEQVIGIANAKGSTDKLKLDATGKKATAAVHMLGDGNAILRSHGPQGTDTKILAGGPRDANEMFQPQYEAQIKATSDDPDKKASVSVKTTGSVHARVRASANDDV